MHPQLVIGDHPCDEKMLALLECHEASPVNRFTGACNDHKAALDRCLRANKKEKVKSSVKEAREKRQKWEAMCRDLGLDTKPSSTPEPK
mmetsp:Transcript_1457/g.4224  ORF Transcript_1457/g.4224 Transcript_1457/m.4224 type:complete len:89 (+) Transcript_1457:53-319(+)